MIFCARLIMEKAREHNTKVFMLFVDLMKAFNSVPPRLSGWCWRNMASHPCL